MRRLFIAGLLILIGTSAIQARDHTLASTAICGAKSCRYVVHRFGLPHGVRYCKTSSTKDVGQDCLCPYRCNQNKVHTCFNYGEVVCNVTRYLR